MFSEGIIHSLWLWLLSLISVLLGCLVSKLIFGGTFLPGYIGYIGMELKRSLSTELPNLANAYSFYTTHSISVADSSENK